MVAINSRILTLKNDYSYFSSNFQAFFKGFIAVSYIYTLFGNLSTSTFDNFSLTFIVSIPCIIIMFTQTVLHFYCVFPCIINMLITNISLVNIGNLFSIIGIMWFLIAPFTSFSLLSSGFFLQYLLTLYYCSNFVVKISCFTFIIS